MKKTLALVVLVLLLASCGLFSKKEEAPAGSEAEKKLEKVIGIIQLQKELPEPDSASPFSLVLENGEKVSIHSLNVNLKRYSKRRVEVEGKWNDASHTIFDVTNVTSLGQETQQKELFQDTKLGMKFFYPSVWEVMQKENALGMIQVLMTPYEVDELELPNVDTVVIERSENNKKLSAREWLSLDEEYRSSDPLNVSMIYQQSFLGAQQLPAVKKSEEGARTVEFFVARDAFIYHFTHRSVESSEKDIFRNAFYDLVQSFEFVPFDDSVATPKLQPSDKTDAEAPATPTPAKAPVSSTLTPVSQVTVSEKMTTIELRAFGAKIAYPANWYWAQRAGGYSFSDKEVADDNVKIHLTRNPSVLPESMVSIGELRGRPATRGEMAEALSVCVQGKEKFCLSGEPGYENAIKQMLQTLDE